MGFGIWMLAAVMAIEPEDKPAAAKAPVPAIRLTESREYHPLVAPSLDSAVAQIQGREPRVGDDGGSVARTRASLAVAYRLVPEGGDCRLEELAVALDVVVRLPQWESEGAMRPEMREQWERMKIGMEVHEQGHRDIAVEAAEHLNTRLHTLALAPGTDCDALERRIVRERIKAQMRHQNRDVAYDKRTRHGITQAPAAPVADAQGPRGPRDLRDRGQSAKPGY